ncbi:MAG: hypothetical protein AAGL24_22415 [Pseudomonadota bacterium]
MARSPLAQTPTVAPKAAEIVAPQARTDLPESKTVMPPPEVTEAHLREKRVREDEDLPDRQRRNQQDSGNGGEADVPEESAEQTDSLLRVSTQTLLSVGQQTDTASSAPTPSDMRAYHEKLGTESSPVRPRVEKVI